MSTLISAYACEPNLGSEIGVGWHWVLELSHLDDLWVLTRESNRHSIEPWIKEHPEFADIHFIYFDLPKWARFWKRGLRGVRTYYNLWQMFANRIVRRTMREHNIDTFHHLTYGNAVWPVSDYGSRQRFIWGPIGGLETIPAEYTNFYDRRSQLVERVRRILVGRAVRSRGLRKRCERADLILCKTVETMERLPEAARGKAVLCTDVAADPQPAADILPQQPHEGLTLIAVGRLDAWRGFDLAIEALARARQRGIDARLAVVGKGMDRERLEQLAAKLMVTEWVTFTGQVGADDYRLLMHNADVVLNPALKEAAVTVSFDAMAMGKPIVALDTGGYTRYFKPEYSVVIERGGRDEVIDRFADAIEHLADADLRDSMSREARVAAARFTWTAKRTELNHLLKK